MKKLKKIIASSILFLNTLLITTQVKAGQILYGPPRQQSTAQTTVQKAGFFEKFLPIILIIFIPVILIIGIIVFLKKRKAKKKDEQK